MDNKEWSFLEYLLTVAIMMRSLPPNPSPSRLWAASATPTDLGSSAFQVATDDGASGLGNNPRQSWELSREHMAGKITAVLSTFCERFTHLGKVVLILIHGTRQKRRNGLSSLFCRLVKRLKCRA